MLRNRFAPSEPSKDLYEYVTLPNHKPSKVKFNQYSAEVYVFCEPVVTEKGKPTQTQNFRATSKALLREQIESKFPTASFTTTSNTNVKDEHQDAVDALKASREQAQMERPVTEDEKRQAYSRLVRAYGQGADITVEKCLAQGIPERVFNALFRQEAENYATRVTQAHRELANELDETERRNHTASNVQQFVMESEWKNWFKAYPNFFSYPDYSNKNYETLMKYCNQSGWILPLLGELAIAHRYLLERGHYFLKSHYPRTSRDEYRRVREFVSIEPDVVPVDEKKNAMDSMKGLSAKQLKENMQQLRNQNLSETERRRRGGLLR